MDYLQYRKIIVLKDTVLPSFKPYYKWITFNTKEMWGFFCNFYKSFKPYYKWITFNTEAVKNVEFDKIDEVLNLIINGLPSIPYQRDRWCIYRRKKSFLYGSKN